jgi:hypothetical protein
VEQLGQQLQEAQGRLEAARARKQELIAAAKVGGRSGGKGLEFSQGGTDSCCAGSLPVPSRLPSQSLEAEIRDFSQQRGKRLKSAQDKLQRAKRDLEAARKQLKPLEQRLQEAVAESESAEGEGKELASNLKGAEAAVKGGA